MLTRTANQPFTWFVSVWIGHIETEKYNEINNCPSSDSPKPFQFCIIRWRTIIFFTYSLSTLNIKNMGLIKQSGQYSGKQECENRCTERVIIRLLIWPRTDLQYNYDAWIWTAPYLNNLILANMFILKYLYF